MVPVESIDQVERITCSLLGLVVGTDWTDSLVMFTVTIDRPKVHNLVLVTEYLIGTGRTVVRIDGPEHAVDIDRIVWCIVVPGIRLNLSLDSKLLKRLLYYSQRYRVS